MAGSFTDTMETRVLQYLIGNTAMPAYTNVTLSLMTGTPSDTAGTAVSGWGTKAIKASPATTEVSNVVGTSTGNWVSSVDGTKRVYTYNADLTFTNDTVTTSTITGVGVFHDGTLLAWSDVTPSKAIAQNESLVIVANTLKISLD